MMARCVRLLVAAMVVVGGAAACDVAGVGQQDDPDGPTDQPAGTWQEQAAAIDGIAVFDPNALSRDHVAGTITYDTLPPVGGTHNDYWQSCEGMVYDAPVANEHAVHSLEHGAVWVTYEPSLPADQVSQLAGYVSGNDFTFLSPFPGLDAPISLQAWGYQLKVADAGDERIAEFIRVLRRSASPEPGAPCGGPGAITATGTEPTVPG